MRFLLLIIFFFTHPTFAKIVRIEVKKASRVMELIDHKDNVVRSYDIMLGKSPIGAKRVRGDNKTPEGIYKIDWRNPQSSYYLSLHISYPNKLDRQRANQNQSDPGDNIFIHGLPNRVQELSGLERSLAESVLLNMDWTNGCIAVSNSDMKEIWELTPNGTEIEILP